MCVLQGANSHLHLRHAPLTRVEELASQGILVSQRHWAGGPPGDTGVSLVFGHHRLCKSHITGALLCMLLAYEVSS